MLVPSAGASLSDIGAEQLLSDRRLEPIWERLYRKHRIDYDLTVVTYIHPESDRTPAMAVFRLTSPHPKPVFPDQKLEVISSMPYYEWRDAEETRAHYVGMGDPAEAILDGLFAEHVYAYTNLKQLI